MVTCIQKSATESHLLLEARRQAKLTNCMPRSSGQLKKAHRHGAADGGAHGALDLAGAAGVGQHRAALQVAAHQLRLAVCSGKGHAKATVGRGHAVVVPVTQVTSGILQAIIDIDLQVPDHECMRATAIMEGGARAEQCRKGRTCVVRLRPDCRDVAAPRTSHVLGPLHTHEYIYMCLTAHGLCHAIPANSAAFTTKQLNGQWDSLAPGRT